jgi:hypothetical protein
LFLALAPVGALGAGCECGCDLAWNVACFCGDGTCQEASGGCNQSIPSRDGLCQSHGGLAPDAGFIDVCPYDAGLSPDAGLQGPHAFPIVGARMSPNDPGAACGLTSTVLADGGIAAVGIQLFSSVSSAAACAVGNWQDAGIETGFALNLVLGTPQFVAANLGEDAGPLTQGLTPGVYTFLNEAVPDQNLCAPGPEYDAVLTVFDLSSGSATPLFNGVGTVTIDEFSNGTLSGTLNAALVPTDGTLVEYGPLTGNFSASLCP